MVNKCCNPFDKTQHTWFKRNLRPVAPGLAERAREKNIPLVAGSFLCNNCRRDLSKLAPKDDDNDNASNNSPDDVPMDIDAPEEIVRPPKEDMVITERALSGEYIDKKEFVGALNKLLPLLGVEQVDAKKIEKSHSYSVNMVQNITTKLGDKIFGIPAPALNTSTQSDVPDPEPEIVSQLKHKFATTLDKHTKVQILSILPTTWSARRISKEFHTSRHMAVLTKKLVAEKGILCEPNKRAATNHITEEVKNRVVKFYLTDNISQPCAGKRDFVTINENNEKVRKQRRLVLMNLEEAYALFKQQNIGQKIGFSTFAALRPKECLLALNNCGTHTVCVCQYHQNVKLIFEPMKKIFEMENFRDLFALMLCNEPTDNCRLKECDQCPGIEEMEQYLAGVIEKNEIDDVSYKQWITQQGKKYPTKYLCTYLILKFL